MTLRASWAGALCACLLVTGCAATPRADDDRGFGNVVVIEGGPSGTFKGTQLPEPMSLPAATFSDTSGKSVTWPADGLPFPVTLVLYAYTSCPDVCNTQLADAAAAIRGLPADQKAEVGVVMVAVDPPRDTAAAVRAYLDKFNPGFVGLRTDDLTTISSSAEALGVGLTGRTETEFGYEVGHGAQLIGFGPDGRARVQWSPGTGVLDMRSDIQTLLTNGGS